jgi:hypothetical protein
MCEARRCVAAGEKPCQVINKLADLPGFIQGGADAVKDRQALGDFNIKQ